MIYLLLIIIAIGVLLISKEGKMLLSFFVKLGAWGILIGILIVGLVLIFLDENKGETFARVVALIIVGILVRGAIYFYQEDDNFCKDCRLHYQKTSVTCPYCNKYQNKLIENNKLTDNKDEGVINFLAVFTMAIFVLFIFFIIFSEENHIVSSEKTSFLTQNFSKDLEFAKASTLTKFNKETFLPEEILFFEKTFSQDSSLLSTETKVFTISYSEKTKELSKEKILINLYKENLWTQGKVNAREILELYTQNIPKELELFQTFSNEEWGDDVYVSHFEFNEFDKEGYIYLSKIGDVGGNAYSIIFSKRFYAPSKKDFKTDAIFWLKNNPEIYLALNSFVISGENYNFK